MASAEDRSWTATVKQVYAEGRWALLLHPTCDPTKEHTHPNADGSLKPCEPKSRGKVPVTKGWNAKAVKRWEDEEADVIKHIQTMEGHRAQGHNLGMAQPPGFVVFDADNGEAEEVLDELYPSAPKQRTRTNRAHFWLRMPPGAQAKATVGKTIRFGSETVVVDVRAGKKSQVIVEPSIHGETGTPYRWVEGHELPANPADVPELEMTIAEQIIDHRNSKAVPIRSMHPRKTNGAAASADDAPIPEGQRNGTIASILGKERRRGAEIAELTALGLKVNEARCRPMLDAGEVRGIAESIVRYPPEPARGGGGGDPRDERPTIHITSRPLDELAAESIEALAWDSGGESMFMRAGSPVQILRDEKDRPGIYDLTPAPMVERLSTAAHWTKHDQFGRITPAHPKKVLAEVVINRARRFHPFPGLSTLTEVPILRKDGSILDTPGYHEEGQVFYAPPPGFVMPPVPLHPTEPELQAAVAMIHDDLLGDFPFVSDAHSAAAVALSVTLVVREWFGLSPLFISDAPRAGTGKGLLANIMGVLATGKPPSLSGLPTGKESDEEFRKKITAALRRGASFIVLDNADRTIWSPSLARALTAEVWEDRILGKSRDVQLEQRATWLVTGNNVSVGGDIPRRCVWCRMDSKKARPWQRETQAFRHPALGTWVEAHRGELLAALFTMARAWIDAGRPEPAASVPQMGSFESWRSVVGGILRVAGIPNFLGNAEEMYSNADDGEMEWAGWLAIWLEIFGSEPTTLKAVVAKMTAEHPTEDEARFRDALPSEVGGLASTASSSLATRLSGKIRRRKDRIFEVDDRTVSITCPLVQGKPQKDRVTRSVLWVVK